jgi:dTDP-4-amino-4,6-dideoxygalactose transaminase
MKKIQPRLNYSLSYKDWIVAFRALFNNPSGKRSQVSNILESEDIYFLDNARSGLQLILRLLPLKSRVGVQPFTCPTVLEAIERAKCKVVFVDINDQLVIDKQSLIEKLDQIDALILTHTFGFPADAKEIRLLLNGKMLIEDCAHAFLSRHENELVGKVGDFAIFSHGFAKFPSAIQGGYVLVNDSAYSEVFKTSYQIVSQPTFIATAINLLKASVLSLSNNIIVYNLITRIIKDKRKSRFSYVKELSKPANIHTGFKTCKSVFENQLRNIDSKLYTQQNNGSKVLETLKKNTSFVVCQSDKGMNYFLIPVLVEQPAHFINYMQQHGIEVGRHFVQSKEVIPFFGYQTGSCVNYEKFIKQVVTLSVHYNYPIKKIDRVLTLIKDYKI